MRVLVVYLSTDRFGANIAAMRLSDGFRKSGLFESVQEACLFNASGRKSAIVPTGNSRQFLSKVKRKVDKRLSMHLASLSHGAPTSLALTGRSGVLEIVKQCKPDVLNLHWIGNALISLRELQFIDCPIVMTMHDMWSFLGGGHYVDSGKYDLFSSKNYNKSKLPIIDRGLVDRKKKVYSRLGSRISFVGPSKWIADCAKGSHLLQNYFVSEISNCLDLGLFQDHDKVEAKRRFKISTTKKVALFGTCGMGGSNRKGYDLLLEAVHKLSSKMKDETEFVIFGRNGGDEKELDGLDVNFVGRINTDADLACLYNAADVLLLPSRLDNLPQTGTEAIACGCPVVAFGTCGLSSVLVHGKTGYLANPFDVNDFAKGIEWVLADNERRIELRNNARAFAETFWSEEIVSERYLNHFSTVVDCDYS